MADSAAAVGVDFEALAGRIVESVSKHAGGVLRGRSRAKPLSFA